MAVKMADEEEGVGESSSNFLLGVRKSIKELMRVALQSKENLSLLEDAEAALSDVPSLVKEKKRLLQEKRSCMIELELRKRLSDEPLKEISFNPDLQERVAELGREVAMARAHHSQDKQLLRRLQSSVVLTDHLFQRPHPTAEEKALQAVAVQQCEVSGDVGRVCVEVEEGEREVGRVRRERAESQARCRELVAQIEELQREPVAEAATAETARLMTALQMKSAECKLLRGCLQESIYATILLVPNETMQRSVIVGSGVDWSESQPLRDLTVSLGQDFSWELSS